jgi:hypothetical protein
MNRLLLFLFLIPVCSFGQNNIVTYAGGSGKETFYDVSQLSDGTFLVAGYAEDFSWLPNTTTVNYLSYSGTIPNALGSNRFGFLMRLSNDLSTILQVVSFPQGDVEDIRFIKTNSLPYQETEDLFISCTTKDTDSNNGGYVIAKLNGNFVDASPTGLSWMRVVWAKSIAQEVHPWDVTSDGEVYYISGEAHGYDWSAMYCLDANGERRVVENWRTHWQVQGGEWKGTPASSYSGNSTLSYSGIVMKSWGRCEMRSWTQEDFDAVYPDGNGGTKKGKWPSDFFYTGPCDPFDVTAESPGYTGYSPEACCPVWGASSIVIDKRNNHVYLGMNFKSYANFEDGTGSPDFEPAVIAFDDTGDMKWWSRLYHEITPEGELRISLPDQYVDALAIDYANDFLVVGARTHGNNTENLWEGNEIMNNGNAHGFQNRFTGTQGDIHESWLGKLQLSTGDLFHSTYLAEMSEGTTTYGTPHADPNLDGWPDPNTGWPNLNTTRITKNNMKVSSSGDVCVLAVGRRTITTANAYQKMVKPYYGGKSCWNSFVRVYEDDFEVPKYSSLIVGEWDTLTEAGGGNTEMYGLYKTSEGVICVGRHIATNGFANGNDIPVTNVPSWGAGSSSNESAILVYYKADNLINPNDGGVVSVSELETEQTFGVFPNPTNAIINVPLELRNIVVYDSLGRPVKRFGVGGSLDTSDLQSGSYYIRAERFGKNIGARFIIQQ